MSSAWLVLALRVEPDCEAARSSPRLRRKGEGER